MKSKKLIWRIIGILSVIIIVGAVFLLCQYTKLREDFLRLKEETYDTVFLSMYSTDNYVEGDYMHFRGMHALICSYEMPNMKILEWYMDKINKSGNEVSTVYLGIDPEKTDKEKLSALLLENPEITFEMTFSHPQIEYWLEKSAEECEEIIEKYQLLAEELIGLANVRIYFFSGEEWLICNKENYEDTFLTNEAVSQFLMCNSDYQHPYMLQAQTIETQMDDLRRLIEEYRESPVEYPDAGGYDIVFFGDSIIANYTDSLSVPQVVKALTGAKVYNCGYGGRSAALGDENEYPVSMLVEALITEDVSALPRDEQVYAGITEFINRENKENCLMFVINYGLNDYFKGYPVETEDDYDITSYSGALRSAVKSLKEAYPEALILLNTPNYTVYFEYGEGIQSDWGGTLVDYAAAVLAVAEEMDVLVLDNFGELPINEENWQEYLSDGCHLNEYGRFILGSRIALKIQ